MNYFAFKTISIFLLIGTIATAQKNVTNFALDEDSELSKLMQKYSNRGIFYPEDFGEQLIDSSKEELIRRLSMSKDTIELRKIAQVLGDRSKAKTLKLTDPEITVIETRIRAYIFEKADLYGPHPEAHRQILRFWDLAIPEMLRNLENKNEDIQVYVFNTLVQMRSERVVRIMINKAKACKAANKDGNLMNMYIGTLGIMTQQQSMGLPNRQTMNEKDSEELFVRVIQPALKRLTQRE